MDWLVHERRSSKYIAVKYLQTPKISKILPIFKPMLIWHNKAQQQLRQQRFALAEMVGHHGQQRGQVNVAVAFNDVGGGMVQIVLQSFRRG